MVKHAALSVTQRTPDAALNRSAACASIGVALFLVGLKGWAAWSTGSTAMLGSLADTSLDLFASVVTLAGVWVAAQPDDSGHRFGHGKAEAFASLVQGGLVFASAALIAREAVGDFLAPHPLRQEGWAVAVMAVSTVLTVMLLRAQTLVLRQTSSVAVSGDRAHYASDLASNIIALIGIAASAWLGVNGLDAAAAMVVAALLLWGAVGVFREASSQLMDQELSDEARAKIVALTVADGRLANVHQLRTRASGPYIHMQMHVDLDPDITLEAAHQAIVAAETRILKAFPAADILIHADPHGRAEPHGGAFAETAHSQ